MNAALSLIFIPIIAALFIPVLERRAGWLKLPVSCATAALCMIIAATMFRAETYYSIPWAGFGLDISLHLNPLAGALIFLSEVLCAALCVYAYTFLKDIRNSEWFFSLLLIETGITNGFLISDSLALSAFFWGASVIPVYGMAALQHQSDRNPGLKAFISAAFSFFCFLAGAGIAGFAGGTLKISALNATQVPLSGWGMTAYLCFAAAAFVKLGAMPFHSWTKSSLTGLRLPAAAALVCGPEKIAAVYLLATLCAGIFPVFFSAGAKAAVMLTASAGALAAALLSMKETDMRRIIGYALISCAGLAAAGLASGTSEGITGGIMQLSSLCGGGMCLFMAAGAVCHRSTTWDIERASGVLRNMPVTAVCLLIAAAALAGFPPFGGFFSAYLIFNSALDAGFASILAVETAAMVFLAASMIRLAHSLFHRSGKDWKNIQEAAPSMTVPMAIAAIIAAGAGFCARFIVTGLFAPALQRTLSQTGEGITLAFMNPAFFILTATLLTAIASHLSGIENMPPHNAGDYLFRPNFMRRFRELADSNNADGYELGMKVAFPLARALLILERMFYFLTVTAPQLATGFAASLTSRLHSGRIADYILMTAAGIILFALINMYGGLP